MNSTVGPLLLLLVLSCLVVSLHGQTYVRSKELRRLARTTRAMQATRPPTPDFDGLPDCGDFDLEDFDLDGGKSKGKGSGGLAAADLDGVPCECITPDILAALDGGKSKGGGKKGEVVAGALDCDFDFDFDFSGKKGGRIR
eukprot:CAMPEP_0194049984 /NCGR_PEP_ID=MMETSP0009_2-20130614/32336_1 /TAXON_ID=210454 /ORGANISM="Grammatophora oceanica, Strain CCMP 410" /LENGTH=140 /DNA_ID=CAMNT_0038696331 /DNA_START=114 /DNA_END=536 /DNA_ORIENTATION=+